MRLAGLVAVVLAACAPIVNTTVAPPSPSGTPVMDAGVADRVLCAPTITHERPPQQLIEFLRAGTSPKPAPEPFANSFSTANWAGNDAFWVGLPADGMLQPTFPPAYDAGWKFWSYATAPGDPKPPFYSSYEVTASARTIDRPTPAGFVAYFNGLHTTGYGPGFLATGLIFPAPGCWEITYRAGAGASGTGRFTFMIDVRR
jgi:hypothetical protein